MLRIVCNQRISAVALVKFSPGSVIASGKHKDNITQESPSPNTVFKNDTIIALKEIEVGEELTTQQEPFRSMNGIIL